jgi:hypothetical protein
MVEYVSDIAPELLSQVLLSGLCDGLNKTTLDNNLFIAMLLEKYDAPTQVCAIKLAYAKGQELHRANEAIKLRGHLLPDVTKSMFSLCNIAEWEARGDYANSRYAPTSNPIMCSLFVLTGSRISDMEKIISAYDAAWKFCAEHPNSL